MQSRYLCYTVSVHDMHLFSHYIIMVQFTIDAFRHSLSLLVNKCFCHFFTERKCL